MVMLALRLGMQAWGCPVAVCRPVMTHRAYFGVVLDLWSQLMHTGGAAGPGHRLLAALVWREVHIVRFVLRCYVCFGVCAAEARGECVGGQGSAGRHWGRVLGSLARVALA